MKPTRKKMRKIKQKTRRQSGGYQWKKWIQGLKQRSQKKKEENNAFILQLMKQAQQNQANQNKRTQRNKETQETAHEIIIKEIQEE